ncbi:T9SS type A sorting domain-containing protein [Hyunsoonleella pacifica]|uniref:T9SS type A sorting domain-containing protein n=1 Tax=Hyunsoonleella pacifica TaxID=1080224 RepID=A0A4Q9FKD1_9FLAO|nr:T9SS type A sorting domain-containing protein [Hyunsoonleella pacifica]TBN13835.1 T9SS type A sorting domain-containing protein [Hyunsoonleella pacifica]GGD26109.1 T9SS C-terminal target domain-containing protein [Hyunsoonleella pacifica]
MIKKLIRYISILVLMIFIAPSVIGQSKTQNSEYRVVRSSVGIGGSSKTFQTSKGKYTISQSIGQASVIGTASTSGYYLRQGFQQPHSKIVIKTSKESSSLKALVFPNPFEERVTISFKETIKTKVIVEIHDVSGKLVYKSQFLPSKTIQLNLNSLSTGSYILKAHTDDKILNSKLIKI